MECRHSKSAAAAAAAPRHSSPSLLLRLQRSRSGSTASSRCLCSSSSSIIVPAADPFSPNKLQGPPPSARSKSAAKSRSSSPATKPISKESRERESPGPVRSAWALSPGWSPVAPAGRLIGVGGGERKNNNGMMGFLTTRRRRKGVLEKEAAAAHQLRLMTSRLLQWRFVNARAAKATATLRSSLERKLFSAWLKINELRNIVAAKWIVIQRRRQKMKVACILNPQVQLLRKWEPLSKRNLEAVTALSTVLQGMCVPLPLVDGAQVDLTLLHDYISLSMDMMFEIEAAVRIFYSKAEELSLLLGELAETVVLEMDGLKQLMSTKTLITSLEMHETSLRANLIQTVKKEIELPQMSSLSSQLASMAALRQYHPWNILA